jgi:hypothetical protein
MADTNTDNLTTVSLEGGSRNQPRQINLRQQNRKIDSEDKLADYIKKQLGDPLITVDITDDQLRLAIDDAFRKWSDFAFSGMENMLFVIETQEDIQDYILDERVQNILGVSFADGLSNYLSSSNGIWAGLPMMDQIPVNYVPYVNAEGQTSSLSSIPGSAETSATGVAGGVAGGPSTGGGRNDPGLAYAMLANSQTLQAIYGSTVSWDYNPGNHILRIFRPFTGKIAVEASLFYYPNPDYDDSFNHPWIKEYATAKAKYIWGQNVGKYSGNLIGGSEINYDRIISEAREDMDKLEEQLIERYSEPLGIFTG